MRSRSARSVVSIESAMWRISPFWLCTRTIPPLGSAFTERLRSQGCTSQKLRSVRGRPSDESRVSMTRLPVGKKRSDGKVRSAGSKCRVSSSRMANHVMWSGHLALSRTLQEPGFERAQGSSSGGAEACARIRIDLGEKLVYLRCDLFFETVVELGARQEALR